MRRLRGDGRVVSTVNWHPHARRNVLLWTIIPATLAVTAFGGLALALKGLPFIALGAVVLYVAFIWFAGHHRLLRKLGARPTSDPVIVNAFRELCMSGGIPVPEIYLSPDTSPNAFAITSSKGAAVYVTRGLRDLLDEREVSAVLGHELAHIRNRDSVFSLLFMSVTNAITITMIAFAALLVLAIASSNDKSSNDKNRRSNGGEAIALASWSEGSVCWSPAPSSQPRAESANASPTTTAPSSPATPLRSPLP
jgi:Zn-dependent protease with chaperone function